MKYLTNILKYFRENRERRIGIDRVKDSVEKRLAEELETITHYNTLMRNIVNQVESSVWSSLYAIKTELKTP